MYYQLCNGVMARYSCVANICNDQLNVMKESILAIHCNQWRNGHVIFWKLLSIQCTMISMSVISCGNNAMYYYSSWYSEAIICIYCVANMSVNGVMSMRNVNENCQLLLFSCQCQYWPNQCIHDCQCGNTMAIGVCLLAKLSIIFNGRKLRIGSILAMIQ